MSSMLVWLVQRKASWRSARRQRNLCIRSAAPLPGILLIRAFRPAGQAWRPAWRQLATKPL